MILLPIPLGAAHWPRVFSPQAKAFPVESMHLFGSTMRESQSKREEAGLTDCTRMACPAVDGDDSALKEHMLAADKPFTRARVLPPLWESFHSPWCHERLAIAVSELAVLAWNVTTEIILRTICENHPSRLPLPQENTQPEIVIARVNEYPHAAEETYCSSKPITFRGDDSSNSTPCPNRPSVPSPHVYKSPSTLYQLCARIDYNLT